MENSALIILIIFSLAGFAAIFFTTFGTLIIFIGAVLYCLLTKFTIVGVKMLLILLVLYLCGEVSEYVFIVLGAKKFGASNKAVVGAIVGGIVGAVAGSVFFGVGLIVGTFLGIFMGAFLVEVLQRKDFMESFKSGSGSLLGRIGSIAAKVVIAVVMLTVIFAKIISYY